MTLEKVDLTSKGARRLDSLVKRINTDDFYLVKMSNLYSVNWITGKFCSPVNYKSWWTFSSDVNYQLTYKNDNMLDKGFIEIYRIDDPDITVKSILDMLKE